VAGGWCKSAAVQFRGGKVSGTTQEELAMIRMNFTTVSTVLATLACALIAPNALADDFDCRGVVGNRSIDSNVVVRGECTLDGTRTDGNVLLKRGAVLRIVNGARIDGNLQSDAADLVLVRDAYIDGDVQLEGVESEISIDDSNVTGNVQLKKNDAGIRVVSSEVKGDVQAFENRGPLRIDANTIDGNLQCKENRSQPLGRSNRVKGNKEDQCRRL